MKNKDFTSASLNGADFTDAVLDHAAFARASLKKAIFKGANMANTGFYLADLTEADLRGITGLPWLSETNLTKANLEGITVSFGYHCTVRGANLKKCKITGISGPCDFSDADLRGANLRAVSSVGSARFKNAIYDDDTAWPDGFDPKAAGAILKAEKTDEKKADDK